MTTNQIEKALYKMYNRHNTYGIDKVSGSSNKLVSHECDFLVKLPSNRLIEIEIKVSKNDLKADFKKQHSHIDKKGRISYLYYAFPEENKEWIDLIEDKDVGILLISSREETICKVINNRYEYIQTGKISSNAHCFRKAKLIKGSRALTNEEINEFFHIGLKKVMYKRGE